MSKCLLDCSVWLSMLNLRILVIWIDLSIHARFGFVHAPQRPFVARTVKQHKNVYEDNWMYVEKVTVSPKKFNSCVYKCFCGYLTKLRSIFSEFKIILKALCHLGNLLNNLQSNCALAWAITDSKLCFSDNKAPTNA